MVGYLKRNLLQCTVTGMYRNEVSGISAEETVYFIVGLTVRSVLKPTKL